MNNNVVAARQTTGWTGLLDRLWRTLAWPRLTVILLVWLAVVLALSAVIPQAPPHLDDPLVRSQWLASVPVSARRLVERLQSLGVFNLLGTVWLRLPLALLLAHALVVLADLSPAIWRRVAQSLALPLGDSAAGTPWVALAEFEQAECRTLAKSFRLDRDWPGLVEQVGPQVMSRLEKAGYRVLAEAGGLQAENQQAFFAWRWRWSWLGLVGIYVGLGLASVGLILAGWLGRVQEIELGPASPAPLPLAGDPNLVLEQVTVAGGDPLSPAAGVASARVLSEVGESRRLNLRLHRSRLFRGLWLTLVDLKPVAEVTAVHVETEESVLVQSFSARSPLQEQVRLPLLGDPEARFVGVPSKNVTLRVDYQAHEAQPASPGFLLSFFRGAAASPSRSARLESGGEVTFGAVRYVVTFDYDAVLRVNRALWWGVVAIGWGMAALSFVLLAAVPPVHVRGQVAAEAKEKSSRITLTVDTLGDRQRLDQELQALVTPDV